MLKKSLKDICPSFKNKAPKHSVFNSSHPSLTLLILSHEKFIKI